jgi:hypothetical protein
MWGMQCEELPNSRGLRFAVELDSRPATVSEVIEAWKSDTDFRAQLNTVLADAPYSAFRWETPAVTAATAATRPFEFVVLDSPGLDRRPDAAAFAEHFAGADEGVATFSNLGGDATMVVPCPVGEPNAYGHLAAFVRRAPSQQQQALWRAVGEAMTGESAANRCG